MAGCYSEWDVHWFGSVHNDGNFTEYYQLLFWNNATWNTGIHNLSFFTLNEYQSSAKLFKIYTVLHFNIKFWNLYLKTRREKPLTVWMGCLSLHQDTLLKPTKFDTKCSKFSTSRNRISEVLTTCGPGHGSIVSNNIWYEILTTCLPVYGYTIFKLQWHGNKILHSFYVGILLPQWFHSPEDYNMKEKNVPQSES